ncbi:polymorphic toxin-type HINT domain-containing protein [Streptomyces sp. NPDC057638]|uniref:polymorphic toxin-type HINT domain-containing protein n=1 Tax=Streptomyces sp. NPDC057638 TaxID=3346190 RepID=UPI0036ADA846
MLALLASVGPAPAEIQDWIVPKDARERWSPRALPGTASVDGSNAPAVSAEPLAGDGRRTWKPARARWPEAIEAETAPAPMTSTARRPRGGAPIPAAPSDGRVPGSPVWITTTTGTPAVPLATRNSNGPANPTAPSKVKVAVADRETTARAGVDGVLLTVRRTDGSSDPGRVTVSLDYTGFRDAFGADWSTRLRLFTLPACALTTPALAECRTRTPVSGGRNERTTARVVADVTLPAAGAAANAMTVVAATAAASGPSGDYKATSLAPSGSWTAGGSSGSMSWSYPVGVPAALGGTAPTVNLSYSSSAVDGRGTSTNNQASWIGEGWEYSPGFVERSYQACSRDGQDKSGEKCWSNQNTLTLSLNGQSSALVQDDVSKAWRLQNDDASRIELLTGASNGDNNGEYWKLTTGDGVQYFFGASHLPGSGNTGARSNAAWTMPVYGNNAGEQCHQASGFDASWCQQTWRWNLDHVIDPRAGLVTYTYSAETSHYTRGAVLVGSGTVTPYTRGGTLTGITYGSKTTDTTQPTARIVFDSAERCLTKDGFDCDPAKMTKPNAAKWPDVPVDKVCAATGTCPEHAPTFWSTRRLTKITTQVLAGSGYQTVDEYALEQDYPDPLDGSSPALWLSKITRTGQDGTKRITMPSVDFTGAFMHNRVDAGGDLAPPMNRRRITGITNETGGQTTFRYNDPECTPTTLPAPDTNTKACYPVWWNYNENAEPVLHWFHKYTVAEVTEIDPTTRAPDRSTRYQYLGGTAWHRDDSELTEDKEASKPKTKDRRTWNDYRGYAEVITRSGVAPDRITQSKTFYLRGMDGDVKKDGTKRSVTVTDSTGAQITDANPLAGSTYETWTYTGDGGTVSASTLTRPWLSAVTAKHTRARGLPDLTARMTRSDQTRSRSLLADGTTWRETSKTTTFEPAYGLPTSVLDKADGLPQYCTTTAYAHNTSAWIIGKPTEIVSVIGDCATAATKDSAYALSRTHYDNRPWGQVGAVGDATTTQAVTSYKPDGTPDWNTTAKTEYDAYGRTVKATDAENLTTTTAYHPATGSLPAKVTTTNPAGWTSTAEHAGSRNLLVKTTDANGLVTEQEHDALGRSLAVWQPGHPKATHNPDLRFSYAVNKTTSSVVTTETLRIDNSYAIAHSILGGFLQERQTQSTTANDTNGRLVADTFYDSLGRVLKTNEPYFNDASGPTSTIFIADDNKVPAQNAIVYDGQGRTTVEAFSSLAQAQWQTRTEYRGADQVSVTPPPGGTATTSVVDARGKPRELRQYAGATPTGTDFTKISYTYGPREELQRATDTAGNTWTYRYDFLGRKIHTDDPDKGTSDTEYDLVGRVKKTTDARDQQLHFTYDTLGRKTGLYKDSVTNANLLSKWTYDRFAKGQADGSTRYIGGSTGAAYTSEITGFAPDSYRPAGTRTTIPAAEGALAGTYETRTLYEARTGKPTNTILPAHGGLPEENLTYAYKTSGQIGSTGGANAYLNWADYDAFGRNTRATLGDTPRQAAFSSRYDPGTGRLLNTYWDKQTATVASVDATSYTYRPIGDVSSISTVRDGSATDTQCFTYDGQRRLKQAWTDNGGTSTLPAPSVPGVGGCVSAAPNPATVGTTDPYWQSFEYDIVGNRTKLVEHDPADDPTKNVTTTYDYTKGAQTQSHTLTSVTTQIGTRQSTTTGYTYDANGNTRTRPGSDGNLQTLTWNAEDKLAQVTSAGANHEYLYDTEGNRIIRREGTKTTLYLGTDELTADTTGGPVTGTRYYPTAGGVTIVRSGGKLTYLANDHHGTGSTTLDATTLTTTRRQSKPFGEPRGPQPTQANAQWPDDKGFLGKPMDATGLTHVSAREYDPTLGRFISVDPIMDLTDAQQMHGYTYAHNTPVTNSDPTGLWDGNACIIRECREAAEANARGSGGKCFNTECPGVIPVPAPKKPPVAPVPPGGGTNTGRGTGCPLVRLDCGGPPKGTPIMQAPIPGMKYVKEKKDRSFWKPIADFIGITDPVDCANSLSPASDTNYGACGMTLLTLATGGAGKIGTKAGKEALEQAQKQARKHLDDAARKCRTHSFPPDTRVLMTDGSTKAIKDIRPGDTVLATDPETGQSKPRTIVASITTEDDKEFAELTVRTGDGEASIIATTNHPFWVPDLRKWTDAGDLKPGNWLQTSAGTWVQVTNTRLHTRQQRTNDLTVDTDHTYYVLAGATPVLVHNSNGLCGTAALENGDWQHIVDRHRPGGAKVDDKAGILTGKAKHVRGRIAETINRGTPRPNTPDPDTGRPRAGQIYEWDFGVPVGRAGPANGGGELTSVRVIVNDGKVVTAFPF